MSPTLTKNGYEYRVRWGPSSFCASPWQRKPFTADELEDWRSQYVRVVVQRRVVYVGMTEPTDA